MSVIEGRSLAFWSQETGCVHDFSFRPFSGGRCLRRPGHYRSVARLGPRAFELCAGFLRIPNGSELFDASSVHPEAYGLARRIVTTSSRDVRSLMGDVATLKSLDPSQFVDERFGLPTVCDILLELAKPGREPAPNSKLRRSPKGSTTSRTCNPA